MSVKIALSGISHVLDLALVPFRLALGRAEPINNGTAARKVVLLNQTADGAPQESAVCLGEPDGCRNAAAELMQSRRVVVLEGFGIEEVAELCFKNNYRWRLDNRPSKRPRFVIEPCVASIQPDSSVRKPPGSSHV